MLFSFNKFWKTLLSLGAGAVACEFVGFELTVVSLLVLILYKNTSNSEHLFQFCPIYGVAHPVIKKGKKNTQVFLVRHIPDPEKGDVSQVGPFHNEKEAINTCVHFLKKGTCSWLVRCDG